MTGFSGTITAAGGKGSGTDISAAGTLYMRRSESASELLVVNRASYPTVMFTTIQDVVPMVDTFSVMYAHARLLAGARVTAQAIVGAGTASIEMGAAQGLVVVGEPCTAIDATVSILGGDALVFDMDAGQPTSGSWLAGTQIRGSINSPWSTFYCRFGYVPLLSAAFLPTGNLVARS